MGKHILIALQCMLSMVIAPTSIATAEPEVANPVPAPSKQPADKPASPEPVSQQIQIETKQMSHVGGVMPEVIEGSIARSVLASDAKDQEDATPESVKKLLPLVKSKKASMCTVKSTLAGASVELDGRAIGQTPLEIVVVRKDQARQIKLSLHGRNPVQYAIWPDGEELPLVVHFSNPQSGGCHNPGN